MKAILVIDMPDMCWECPLCHNDCVCDIIGDVTDEDCVDMRCPLKPMPEFENAEDLTDMYDAAFSSGWNSCLIEILGEKE